jgi:hypothetical protein
LLQADPVLLQLYLVCAWVIQLQHRHSAVAATQAHLPAVKGVNGKLGKQLRPTAQLTL